MSLLERCQGLDPGGTHLVVHTAYGRASLLLLPNTTCRPAASIAERGRAAALLPAGKGVVGVVADSPAQACLIRRLLSEAIEWQG